MILYKKTKSNFNHSDWRNKLKIGHPPQIKTHGSVMQFKKWGTCNTVRILTGRNQLQCSHICSPVMSDPNGTKFTMEVPFSQEKPHFKFNLNILEIKAMKFSINLFVFILSYSSFCTLYKILNSSFNPGNIYWGVKRQTWAIDRNWRAIGTNFIKTPRVINDFAQKIKSNFYHSGWRNKLKIDT